MKLKWLQWLNQCFIYTIMINSFYIKKLLNNFCIFTIFLLGDVFFFRNKLKVVKQTEAHEIEKHTYLFIHLFSMIHYNKKSCFGKCERKKWIKVIYKGEVFMPWIFYWVNTEIIRFFLVLYDCVKNDLTYFIIKIMTRYMDHHYECNTNTSLGSFWKWGVP